MAAFDQTRLLDDAMHIDEYCIVDNTPVFSFFDNNTHAILFVLYYCSKERVDIANRFHIAGNSFQIDQWPIDSDFSSSSSSCSFCSSSSFCLLTDVVQSFQWPKGVLPSDCVRDLKLVTDLEGVDLELKDSVLELNEAVLFHERQQRRPESRAVRSGCTSFL